MAATAIALHLKPKIRLVSNPKFSLLYSSSSSNFNEEPQDGHTSAEFQSHPDSSSSSSSDFNIIKAKLRLQSPQQQFHISSSSAPSSPDTSKFDHSLESEPLSYQKSYDQILKDRKWIEEQVKDMTSSFNSLRENSKQIFKDRDIERSMNKLRMEVMKKKKLKKKLKLTERLANPKEMEQKESDESIVSGSIFFKDFEGKP